MSEDADVDRLTAIKELLDRCIRRPNEQYAYSRCEVCDTAFWDREEHRFGCKLLEWRDALRDQSLSQEAGRDAALDAALEMAEKRVVEAAIDEIQGSCTITCHNLQNAVMTLLAVRKKS